MRGTFVGHIVAVYKRKQWTKHRGDQKVDIPEMWFLLLATGYDAPCTRVRLSDAQASELSNPSLQFEQVSIVGEVTSDPGGFGQIIDCSTYTPVNTAA